MTLILGKSRGQLLILQKERSGWAAEAPRPGGNRDQEPWGMIVSDGGRGEKRVTDSAFAFV